MQVNQQTLITQFGGFIMARKNDSPQKAAMRELCDIDISDSTISRITDKILPVVNNPVSR